MKRLFRIVVVNSFFLDVVILYIYRVVVARKMLTHEKAKMAVEEFPSNFHTGIDLMHHPPNEVPITDQSLMEFAGSLEMTAMEITRMKSVAEKVLAHTLQAIPNANSIEKVIMSECHLCNCGRNDCGLDIVVLMNRSEDVQSTSNHFREKIQAMTSAASGRSGVAGSGIEAHVPKPMHAETLHFEFEDIHFNLAVGTRHGSSEEANRFSVWNQIETLDKENKLKKTHLDQFAIDLYESTTMFMNSQVMPEKHGAPSGSEKFLQGALRLARAWRQCCLSSRDVQFAPMDAWLIMLKAVHEEMDKGVQTSKEPTSGISNIGRRLKGLFKGGAHVPQGLSMKNVLRTFLNDLAHLENVNIMFHDMYDMNKVPAWIKGQRPLVLDPVCPYRNTVYNLHKRVNEDIKKHAEECLKTLDTPAANLPKLFHLPTYKKRGA